MLNNRTVISLFPESAASHTVSGLSEAVATWLYMQRCWPAPEDEQALPAWLWNQWLSWMNLHIPALSRYCICMSCRTSASTSTSHAILQQYVHTSRKAMHSGRTPLGMRMFPVLIFAWTHDSVWCCVSNRCVASCRLNDTLCINAQCTCCMCHHATHKLSIRQLTLFMNLYQPKGRHVSVRYVKAAKAEHVTVVSYCNSLAAQCSTAAV